MLFARWIDFSSPQRFAKHRLFFGLRLRLSHKPPIINCTCSRDRRFISLGLLQSRVHQIWALSQGTQVRERESGFRYTPTTCFETFPLPEATQRNELRSKHPRRTWRSSVEMAESSRVDATGSPGVPRLDRWTMVSLRP